MRLSRWGAFLLSASMPCAAIAQDASPVAAAQGDAAGNAASGTRTLTPDVFTPFNPITAFDMVERIPGFSIEQGEGRRGFGENAGNVLIDGDRPSTKSDDISTLLKRIPASEVQRIEVTEAAGADAETQGKGQVVNVVRKVSSKLSGTASATLLVGKRYGFVPFGSTSATLRRGPTSYEINLSSDAGRSRYFGPEDFRDGSAQLIERRFYQGRGTFDEFSIGGAIKTRIGAAKVNVNGKYELETGIDRRLGTYTNPSSAIIGSERLFTDQPITDSSFELGMDIEFPLAPKLSTKLVGLYQSGTESTDAFIETIRVGQPLSLFETSSRNKPSEAVFRVQNDWTSFSGHAVQFGAELAFNRLDASFAASSLSGGTATLFPASNVLVKETRIEPFLSDTWSISPKWKLEGGAILEFSTLTLTGDSSAKRSFQFIKPRLIATWTASKVTTVELRVVRQVAQLDFNDYATTVDLGQGNQVDAGNQDLVPEKITEFAAVLRQKFLDRGSIQLTASYQQVSDTQDLVLITTRDAAGAITGRFDGAGNIGKSKRWNAELEITLPFDWLTKPIGLSGIELKYVGHYHGSKLTDPVTGQNRRVSYRPQWHQSWDLRHDIKGSGFVWGLSWQESATNNAYFFNLYRRQKSGSEVSAFVEYNKFKLGTVRVEGFNLTGAKLVRDRFFYTDTRASNTLNQIINRVRTTDPAVQISLSGKF
jgi:hypothetical protein